MRFLCVLITFSLMTGNGFAANMDVKSSVTKYKDLNKDQLISELNILRHENDVLLEKEKIIQQYFNDQNLPFGHINRSKIMEYRRNIMGTGAAAAIVGAFLLAKYRSLPTRAWGGLMVSLGGGSAVGTFIIGVFEKIDSATFIKLLDNMTLTEIKNLQATIADQRKENFIKQIFIQSQLKTK